VYQYLYEFPDCYVFDIVFQAFNFTIEYDIVEDVYECRRYLYVVVACILVFWYTWPLLYTSLFHVALVNKVLFFMQLFN